MFEPASERWEIRGKDGGVIVHKSEGQKTFPVGLTPWIFSDSSTRYLRLQQDVKRPGMFCCDSGLCLDSQLVCDGKSDCDDSSDENDCEMIIFPKSYQYNSDQPPARLRRKRNVTVVEPLDIELDLDILAVLDVDDINYEIEVLFLLVFTWHDHHLYFKYLRENSNKNHVKSQVQAMIWRPNLSFYIENDDKSKKYEDKLTVVRKSSPKMIPAGEDPRGFFKEGAGKNKSVILDYDEVYAGELNPLKLTTEKRKVF